MCGWHIAVGAGGNYWRFGVIVALRNVLAEIRSSPRKTEPAGYFTIVADGLEAILKDKP